MKAKKVMRSEIAAEYVLEGGPELDPDFISITSGLHPSEIRRIGDDNIPNAPQLGSRFNSWCVKSNLSRSADLQTQVENVLDQLTPAWQVLQGLGAQYDAAIACTIYAYGGDRPPIAFGKRTIKRIAELNAQVDIDLYILD